MLTKFARVIISLAICCAALPARSQSSAPWTDAEKAMLVAAEVLNFIDIAQTKKAITQPNYYEANPILGHHPSKDKLTLYWLAVSYNLYVLADNNPEYRKQIFGTVIVLESLVINHNAKIGLTFSF